MSRRLAQIVCAVFGIAMFLLFFSPHPLARAITLTITTEYWQLIYAAALIVGTISFLRVNIKNIERGNDRFYRFLSIVGLIAMPTCAIFWGINVGSPFMWIFENIQVPLQSTVFALLAFFVASASFRGFRARSLPAAVLLISAVLILLSRSWAEGEIASMLISAADWVRGVPSMAARRAILIGIGLGSLTTSLRVILGIERTWLGGGK